MLHKMNLWHDSFEAIRNKTKTIEMRLNDEKRSRIKLGDIIEFTDTGSGETIRCTVLNLFRYADFETLYRNHTPISIGYKENETALPSDMLIYYSQDDVKKYGVVGIEVRVI